MHEKEKLLSPFPTMHSKGLCLMVVKTRNCGVKVENNKKKMINLNLTNHNGSNAIVEMSNCK